MNAVLEQVHREYVVMPVAELIETAKLMGVEAAERKTREQVIDELMALEQYACFH